MVCSVVLFSTLDCSAHDAAWPCHSRRLQRSPPGLKPHAHRGEDAGLRARGLWCFERLIWIGHRDRLENLGHQPLPPAVLPGGRSSDRRRSHPGSCRAKGFCRGGIDLREDGARRPGQNWPFRWRGSASEPRPGSLSRLVGSAACRLGAQWPPLPRQRAISTPDSQRRPRRGPRGISGFESRAARHTPASSPMRRCLGEHAR